MLRKLLENWSYKEVSDGNKSLEIIHWWYFKLWERMEAPRRDCMYVCMYIIHNGSMVRVISACWAESKSRMEYSEWSEPRAWAVRMQTDHIATCGPWYVFWFLSTGYYRKLLKNSKEDSDRMRFAILYSYSGPGFFGGSGLHYTRYIRKILLYLRWERTVVGKGG